MYSLFEEGSSVGSETLTHIAGFEVVSMVRRLAKEEHSAALAQLASRISAIWKFGALTGEDPFAKVIGVITKLFGRLQGEASSEASQKACCDEEMSKSIEKTEDLEILTLRSTHSSLKQPCPDLPLWTARSRRFSWSSRWTPCVLMNRTFSPKPMPTSSRESRE